MRYDDLQWPKLAKDSVPSKIRSLLADDEAVLFSASGAWATSIVISDRNVFLNTSGIAGGSVATFPLALIQFVDLQMMVRLGFLTIGMQGTIRTPKRGFRDTAPLAARRDPNSLIVWPTQGKQWRIVQANLQTLVERSRRDEQSPGESKNAQNDGLARQLTELAALHDRGVLSDAEFAEAKRRLLAP
ncbi:MAG: SHOCT domain-containing protein [Actinomycetota bacterium]|nr:SHOCT domain-containing protein [Actinomycetota bacterium]